VNALAISGSDLYAGGSFTNVGGVAANWVAKWDGSSWSALGSGISGGYGVYALALSGSNLYAAGKFGNAGGIPANNIARWDGTRWWALRSGVGNGAYGVYALAASGNALYAGGDFSTANGSVGNYIAKWDGTNWTALGSGIGVVSSVTLVHALALSGNDLYVGGSFLTAGGKISSSIARAYLLPLPKLSVLHFGPEVTVSWPSPDTAGFSLEQSATLATPTTWLSNTATVSDDGTNKWVTLPATNITQFFRLRRP
jgi:hypothetical protein